MGAKMEPIRDGNTVHDIEVTLSKLEDKHGRRMFLMFEVGLRLGLRVSDMIQLKVGDLRGKNTFTFLPQKQSHKKGARPITITIEGRLRRILSKRCEGMDDEDWLFPSRRKTPGGNVTHISRQQARLDMKTIGQLCGLKEDIGCHTLRKTFGYHYYRKQKDIARLQKWFYHNDQLTTMIYIGIDEDDFRKMTDNSPFDDYDGVVL